METKFSINSNIAVITAIAAVSIGYFLNDVTIIKVGVWLTYGVVGLMAIALFNILLILLVVNVKSASKSMQVHRLGQKNYKVVTYRALIVFALAGGMFIIGKTTLAIVLIALGIGIPLSSLLLCACVVRRI